MTTVTLTLRAMAHGGEALGDDSKKTVFVPLAIPGEKVRVRIDEEHKHLARATLLEVLEPSPQRVQPPCRYFGECGGCQWQHIAYEAQLEFKREILRGQLQRIGKVAAPLVHPVLGMDDPWSYRNHVQLSVDEEGGLGYQALRSHRVVAVDECWIIDPLLEELWASLEMDAAGLRTVSLRAGVQTGEQMIIFEGNNDEEDVPELEADLPISCVYHLADGRSLVLVGEDSFHERLGGREHRVSSHSFFQVNTAQAERMLEVVRAYVQPAKGGVLLDAYCGVGAFALALAGDFARVVGIEESPAAIEDAIFNGRDNPHVEFVEGAVEEVLPGLLERCDVVVLDPPRAGCAPEVLKALAALAPKRIVYVSCDPATLARDVAHLGTLGYALVEAQPIDMFPQTYHVETVTLIERVGNG
ncbi:MAG: 23S rRNA (uracil(1939)-C(5))-methyltransferase RlmD [Anaerolineae bacterium]